MRDVSGTPPAGRPGTPAPLVPLTFMLTATYLADPADYRVAEPAAMAAEDLEIVTAAADRWGVLDLPALVAAVRTTCGELDQVAAVITPAPPGGTDARQGPAVVLPAGEAAQVRAALAAIADGSPLDGWPVDAAREPDPRAVASAALALLTRATVTATHRGPPAPTAKAHRGRP